MSFIRSAFACCALGLGAAASHAQTATPAVSTAVAFSVSNPIGNIVRGGDGALYGVAVPATSVAGGLVYRATVDGSTVTTIYQLTPEDAYTPQGGLTLGSDGLLYGTTKFGTASDVAGAGSVFRLTIAGTDFTILHRFATVTATNQNQSPINVDGAYPGAELVEGSDGSLYGLAGAGGPAGTGTIYKLARDGANFQVLHTFAAITSTAASELTVTVDGASPGGQLVQGADGMFYGTASLGGTNGMGTVFRIAFDGSNFEVLHHFSATTEDATTGLAENADGAKPAAGLVDGNDGFFYGVTSSGGPTGQGVIFAISPDGTTFNVLYNFDGPTGVRPLAELLLASDGRLYGTTASGGVSSSGATTSLGTIFAIDRAGTNFTRLYSFDSSNGSLPASRLLELSSGLFAGTTPSGGRCGYGTLYEYSAAGSTVEGNKKCGTSNDNDSNGGGAGGPALLLLLCGLALGRSRRS